LTNIFNTLQSLEDLMRFWLENQSNQDIDQALEKLNGQGKRLKEKLARLIDAITEGVLTSEEARPKRGEINNEHDRINEERNKLANQRTLPPDWDSLHLTREEFDHLDAHDQRRFLTLILERIRLYDSYAILNYRFPRNKQGDCTARIHLPPSTRGCGKGRAPRIRSSPHKCRQKS
jgi:hypothetical protein